MKLYQLTDNDIIGLMESLTLKHMEQANVLRVSPDLMGQPVNDIHSAYHFVVVRWLQSIGAEKLSREWS